MKFNFQKLFGIRIPLYIVLPILIVSLFLSDYFDVWGYKYSMIGQGQFKSINNQAYSISKSYRHHTLSSGQFVYPILFNDAKEESLEMADLKVSVNNLILSSEERLSLLDAAVYCFDFSNQNWFGINSEKSFLPGSLMKIATGITVMKLKEYKPDFLNKKIKFTQFDDMHVEQTMLGDSLVYGAHYSVSELLSRMLIHSDNNSTFLLNKACGIDALRKTYKDFGISMPHDANYQITIHQYVRFFKALYYSIYLPEEDSQYLLDLMSKSSFKKGLEYKTDQLSNVVIAHKFGEREYDGISELHDVGIAYKHGNAFLIGVMAKGKSRQDLEKFIGQVSETLIQVL